MAVPFGVAQYYAKRWNDALATYNAYGIHPYISLAQGALESGNGTSGHAANGNNHGLTVGGPSAATPHYDTRLRANVVTPTGVPLSFRNYRGDNRKGYLDFGHFITRFTPYVSARPYINQPAQWALAIAQTPYISTKAGDNPRLYSQSVKDRVIWAEEWAKTNGKAVPYTGPRIGPQNPVYEGSGAPLPSGGGGSAPAQPPPPPKQDNTIVYGVGIGLGLLALGGTGVAVARRRKRR